MLKIREAQISIIEQLQQFYPQLKVTVNYSKIVEDTETSKMLIHDSLPFPPYHDVTDICHEGPFLHGLKDLNILQIRPSEHFPPEEVAGGEVLVTKLARDQLTLGALPCSRASW